MKLLRIVMLLALAFIISPGCSAPDDKPKDIAINKKSPVNNVLPAFEAEDLKGKQVTNDIFKGKQLTIINIWGTFCGPCINEMPDLQRLSQDLKAQNVQFIGIVADMELGNAQKITAAQGVTYINIIPDESLIENLVSKYDYVPTTVFADSEGKLLSTVISGSRNYDSYKAIIDNILLKQDQEASE